MNTLIAIGCGTALAVVFLIAMIGKARSLDAFRDFADSIRDMRLVPGVLTFPAAAAVITFELGCVLTLAIPRTMVIGFGLSLLLLAGLTGVVVIVVASGREADCRCFGGSGTRLSMRHIARNVTLLLIAMIGTITRVLAGNGSSISTSNRIFAVSVGVLGGLAVARWDDIVFLIVGEESSS
jgi:Methylamine utilisation protein MauE